jgi:hypothetical protein
VPEGDEHAWHYRLAETHFNALAGTSTVPAFLLLVVVPPDARDYTRIDLHWLRLGRACYWASLADRPRIANPRADRRIPVPVPRQNLLTVDALTALCAEPAVQGAGTTDSTRLAGTP